MTCRLAGMHTNNCALIKGHHINFTEHLAAGVHFHLDTAKVGAVTVACFQHDLL
jgi:hypothetical protein